MRQHYFSLSLADDAGRTRSIVMKCPNKSLTAPIIRVAMQKLDMTENATLLSACWLGKMTEREYAEGVEVKSLRRFSWPLAVISSWVIGSFIAWFLTH